MHNWVDPQWFLMQSWQMLSKIQTAANDTSANSFIATLGMYVSGLYVSKWVGIS